MYGRDANCVNNGLKPYFEYITIESFNIPICPGYVFSFSMVFNRTFFAYLLYGYNSTDSLIGCFPVTIGHY